MRAGRRAALGLLLGSVVVAGCGVPVDDDPRAISRENVPEGVITDSTPTTNPEFTAAAEIYLVRSSEEDARLVPVDRRVGVDSEGAAPGPASVLEALLEATPTEEEQNEGITTQIPSDTQLASPPEDPVDGTLVVNLTSGIFEAQGTPLITAFGQITCTVVRGLGDVDAVTFEVDGEPREVPAGRQGALTDDPVTCVGGYGHLLR
ncbi:MAG TPA: GerMN domain-containing protein [Acidimicrobiales bacterium]|jgi:spore germination protein GerM|nr:GerMN domain-containing protein [Acidimicrobiales bacterium]